MSQEIEKVSIPGRKNLYRLYNADGEALCDLMTHIDEAEPKVNERVLCRHPFSVTKRAMVTPSFVRCLYKLYWADGRIQEQLPPWHEVRSYAQQQIGTLRKDYRRPLNPTPYKVSVSGRLYTFLHELWVNSVPIGDLS